jgi:hypothetical protein
MRSTPRGSVPARLGLAALLLAVGGAAAGCGSTSKADAVSAFSSQFAKSSVPNAGTFAQCIGDKLYDSGKFSSDEIQKIVSASSSQDIPTDLAGRFVTDVITPCTTSSSTTSSSSSSAASST